MPVRRTVFQTLMPLVLMLACGWSTPAFGQGGRHALVVVIGNYGAGLPRLAGADKDRDYAQAIARRLGIAAEQTTVLSDAAASADGIRRAAAELAMRTAASDQLLLYFAGLGSQRADPDRPGGCEETFVAHGGTHLGHGELADFFLPAVERAEKTIALFDSCNRADMASGQPQRCVPPPAGQACAASASGRWRGFVNELRKSSVSQVNVAALLATPRAGHGEARGGEFGAALAACVAGAASDANASGALSVGELAECVAGQVKTARPLPLDGARGFAPLWSGGDGPVTELFADIYAGRDGRRKVLLDAVRPANGAAGSALTLRSESAGYLYLVASDGAGDYKLLFPSAEDRDNRLRPGAVFSWPRSGGIAFAPGTRVLALIADNEHDSAPLLARPPGPAARREALYRFAATSVRAATAPCMATGSARNLSLARACSNAYAAALLTIDVR